MAVKKKLAEVGGLTANVRGNSVVGGLWLDFSAKGLLGSRVTRALPRQARIGMSEPSPTWWGGERP